MKKTEDFDKQLARELDAVIENEEKMTKKPDEHIVDGIDIDPKSAFKSYEKRKKMKKIELEPGQVWQAPDKKEIRVRTITFIRESEMSVYYVELGELGGALLVERRDFLRWIHRNNAKLIGIKDFKTGRVRVVK